MQPPSGQGSLRQHPCIPTPCLNAPPRPLLSCLPAHPGWCVPSLWPTWIQSSSLPHLTAAALSLAGAGWARSLGVWEGGRTSQPCFLARNAQCWDRSRMGSEAQVPSWRFPTWARASQRLQMRQQGSRAGSLEQRPHPALTCHCPRNSSSLICICSQNPVKHTTQSRPQKSGDTVRPRPLLDVERWHAMCQAL